jgi:RNA polymerase sigma-70 factor (ECF subfamily)
MPCSVRQQQRFQQLTRPWRERLYGIAMLRANTSTVAEDWLQETLLRAWKDFDRLSDDIAIYAWLLKILDHVIADDTRRNSRRDLLAPVVATDDQFLQQQPSAAPGPFEQTLQQQTDEQVRTAIKSLPDRFCSVILLRDIEGLSYRQVADILDIPQGTVMSRLSRARRLLATILLKEQNRESAKKDNLGRTGVQ